MTVEELLKEIEKEIDAYEKELADIEKQLREDNSDNVYAMLIGRKYAYVSFLETLEALERRCKSEG